MLWLQLGATREIAALLEDPSYRKRAQSIAQRIAAEDGVAAFADLLEKMLDLRN